MRNEQNDPDRHGGPQKQRKGARRRPPARREPRPPRPSIGRRLAADDEPVRGHARQEAAAITQAAGTVALGPNTGSSAAAAKPISHPATMRAPARGWTCADRAPVHDRRPARRADGIIPEAHAHEDQRALCRWIREAGRRRACPSHRFPCRGFPPAGFRFRSPVRPSRRASSISSGQQVETAGSPAQPGRGCLRGRVLEEKTGHEPLPGRHGQASGGLRRRETAGAGCRPGGGSGPAEVSRRMRTQTQTAPAWAAQRAAAGRPQSGASRTGRRRIAAPARRPTALRQRRRRRVRTASALPAAGLRSASAHRSAISLSRSSKRSCCSASRSGRLPQLPDLRQGALRRDAGARR